MKNVCSLLIGLAIGLADCLWAPAVSAQGFRPFRPALSYQLSEAATPGDTTHLLRLAPGQRQGNDSLFLFSKRTSRGRGAMPCGRYVERPDHLMGTSLLVRAGGEYVLAAANGRTFTLRLRLPLGQAWPATAAGLTARVTARTLGQVLGQADSLTTITLSDGAVLVLSKRWGWVSGPALGRYLNPRLPQATLTLSALPELRLGTPQLSAFAVYDFQPGDVFLRKTTSYGFGLPCNSYQWTRDSVLSRAPGQTTDTLVYRVRRRTLSRPCPGPVALSAPVVLTLRISPASEHLDQPTGFWEQTATLQPGLVHLPASRTAAYNGRPVQRHLVHRSCSPPADTTKPFDTSSLDYGYHVSTAAGLGQTLVEVISFSGETTELIGYRKGPETWGQLTTFAQLLPTCSTRPAASTIALPNPFGSELAVQVVLARPQTVAAELRDALGRLVLAPAAQPLAAGPQQVLLPTVGLPAGLYTLHLHYPAEGRTEVLKVLKAE